MPVEVLAPASDETLSRPLEAAAEVLLGLLGCADDELTVSLVDDTRIHELNRDFRGVDRPTDVLAFAQAEGEPTVSGGPTLLGDIVISVDTMERQAAEGGWTAIEEATRLVVHGLLHLLGYDHERGPEDKAAMRAEELRLARALAQAGFPCAFTDDAWRDS